MAQDWAKPFYGSMAWRKCRDAYIQKRIAIDGGLCEMCHKNLGYIVHHENYLNELNVHDPGVSLNFNNLKYVCLDCHNAEHNGPEVKTARIGFDENGEPYPLPDRIDETPPIK